MNKKIISVLGCGKMTKTIFVAAHELIDNFEYNFYTPNSDGAKYLAQITGGKVVNSVEHIPCSDIYFIGCKPQNWSNLCEKLKKIVNSNSLIVSIMAGIECEQIAANLSISKLNVMRAMPNSPALVRQGVTLIHCQKETEMTKLVQLFFEKVSSIIKINDEEHFHLFSGLFGSAPAYLFYLMEIYEKYCSDNNLKVENLRECIAKLFLGSATLALSRNEEFSQLREDVTSKKGITQKALEVLEEGAFDKTIFASLNAAMLRSKELGK